MKNSELYHTLPTIRKARRRIRRIGQKFTGEYGKGKLRAMLVCKDNNGANILRTRRWRNRIKTEVNNSLN